MSPPYTSPRLLQRAIGLFGAGIAADALEEVAYDDAALESVAPPPATLVVPALRQNAQQANEAPQDVAPLLYSVLRRERHSDGVIELSLGLDATDVSLRIETYVPPEGTPPRIRPPGPVAAIHAPENGDDVVIRCDCALTFVDGEDRTTTFLTPTLTASATNGDLCVTGDAEGTVTFWDVSPPSIIQRAAAHQGRVTHVLIDAERVFSCGADGTVVEWEQTGAEWLPFRVKDTGSGVSAAAILDDVVAVGCRNGDVFELSRTGDTHHVRAHEGPVTGIVLRREAYGIVSAGADRFLRACRHGAPESAVRVDTGHTTGITGIAASSRDLCVTYALDRTARVWRVRGEGEVGLLTSFGELSAAVTAACFGQVEGPAEWLVMGAADGTVQGGALLKRFAPATRRHRSAVRACTVRRGIIFTGGDDGRLIRSTGDLVPMPDGGITDCASEGETAAVCAAGQVDVFRRGVKRSIGRGGSRIALSPDGRRLLLWEPGARSMTEWDVVTGGQLEWRNLDAPVVQCAYASDSPVAVLANGDVEVDYRHAAFFMSTVTAMAVDSSNVVIGRADGEVSSIGVGAESKIFGRHAAPVTAVAAHGDVVASGTGDGELIVWLGAIGSRIRRNAGISRLAFGADDTVIAVYDDARVAMWNYRRHILTSCVGHKAPVTGVVAHNGRIYTASADRTVRVWDYEGNQLGIVYGNVPFSALTLIRGNAMPGEVLAGDDAGALWTLTYHDVLGNEPPPGAEEMPTPKRTKAKKVNRKPLRKKMSKKK